LLRAYFFLAQISPTKTMMMTRAKTWWVCAFVVICHLF
jgi:hypothetical protein